MPWFGDKAKCEERYKAGCERNLKLPDVSASLGTALQSCASSIGGKSCDAMLSASTLTCLNAAGTRDNGLPCSRHVQCKSAYCKAVANEECGVCAGKKGDGGDCTSTDGCEVGLDCIGGKCGKKTIAQPGEACDDKTKPCKFGYGCVGNVCKKQGEAGASCDPAAKSNDCSVLDKLLYCKEDAKTCAKITVAEGTGECPGVAICKAGYCPTSGKCIPRVGDGEDCDEATGKFCMLPARCVKGICTLASPNKCN